MTARTTYSTATTDVYDVAVIGAGVVGAAITRDLVAHELRVAIVEARDDVGDGTSKANTAILHTGFDATPGTVESRLVRRGYQLLSDYAGVTGIPVEHTGALLVAWTDEELQALPGLRDKAVANGYHRCKIVDSASVYAQVPTLGEGALGGLTVPDESIICTWTTTLALATEARLRGADLLFNHRVTGIDMHTASGPSSTPVTTLHTDAGDIRARWVINAAGLGCDHIDALYGYQRFTVTPRRGELLVFDKLARPLVNKIVLSVPSTLGKGVLISPTIYGNVMLGPTAEDLTDRTATGTSEAGFQFLFSKGQKRMPRLLQEEVTASYAGLRAAINSGDYLIDADTDRRYLLVGGIRSTGLTSAMAIAEHVLGILADAGLPLIPRSVLPEPPQMPNIGEAFTRPYQDDAAIQADPAYGTIVCFCERVTAGEIRDAFASPIPPAGAEGLRRRTRVLNGRCQGFFCGAEVDYLLRGRDHTDTNLAEESVTVS
jgi:glycerol-3-phosphate dehydrogenase